MNSATTAPHMPDTPRPISRVDRRSMSSQIAARAARPDRSQALGFEVHLRVSTHAQWLLVAATGEPTWERCGERWPMYEQVANGRRLATALVTPGTRAVGETRVVRAHVPQTVATHRLCSPVSTCV